MPSSVETLIIGYLAGFLASTVGLLVAILVYVTGSPGRMPDVVALCIPYYEAFPNTFIIGFCLGASTTVSGGAAVSKTR